MVESLQSASYGISFALCILAFLTCVLRLYSRKFIVRDFGWDDWFMVAVTASIVFQQAIFTLFIAYGGRLHLTGGDADLMLKLQTGGDADLMLKLQYVLIVQQPFYVFIHFIVKTSFLIFYLRLIPFNPFTHFVWAAIAVNTVLFIISLVIYFVTCIPLDAVIHPAAHPNAVCIPRTILFYLPSSFSIFMDLVILILPVYPLWNINVTLKRRIQMIALVSFGGVAVLASFLRIVVTKRLAAQSDLSISMLGLTIVSAVEIYIGVMAANIPGLMPIWTKHLRKRLLRKTDSNPNPYSHELSDRTPKMKGKRHSTANGLTGDTYDRKYVPHLQELWRDDASEDELVDRSPDQNTGIKVTSIVMVQRGSAPSEESMDRQYDTSGHGLDKR
ncbi:hypothetical protein BU16DRAFT_576230 [Lophium mytilinum]|uniref:Rhodopsin domain-containing protein n=1 Tax=Lophium mytilinum TaxID=390894 RepID=A0A6A6REK7_9PEZI|nr:hypothetical protein BU16DRAFT_576230 [Lophium mytilinum]